MDHHSPQKTEDTAHAARKEALLALLARLKASGYEFVTPTPATHARVIARRDRVAKDIRDVLGWSLPFSKELLDPDIWGLLAAGGVLRPAGPLYRSTVRVSSLKSHLFLHEAYPTVEETAVFFGPDSYRFANLIEAEMAAQPGRAGSRIFDMGTGSGVGAIVAAGLSADARIMASDINPKAVDFARINAAAAGVRMDVRLGADMAGVEEAFDIMLMNPPYIIDPGGRLYRDGGGQSGAGVTLDMATAAIDRLAQGGRLILYSGSAIADGVDHLHRALVVLCDTARCALHYRELDPDIFGEELETPQYAGVDRIAVIAATISPVI